MYYYFIVGVFDLGISRNSVINCLCLWAVVWLPQILFMNLLSGCPSLDRFCSEVESISLSSTVTSLASTPLPSTSGVSSINSSLRSTQGPHSASSTISSASTASSGLTLTPSDTSHSLLLRDASAGSTVEAYRVAYQVLTSSRDNINMCLEILRQVMFIFKSL